MKNIIAFITEGLKIGSRSKVNNFKEYSDAEIDDLLDKYTRNDIPQQLKNEVYYNGVNNKWNHIKKMEYYHNKGSKPERLVSSIKDKDKLIKRWLAAMDIDWKEAADIFKDEIVKRGYYNDEDLFLFVLIFLVKNNKEKYKKFLW